MLARGTRDDEDGRGGRRARRPRSSTTTTEDGPDLLRVRHRRRCAGAGVRRPRAAACSRAGPRRRARCAASRSTRRATSARGATATAELGIGATTGRRGPRPRPSTDDVDDDGSTRPTTTAPRRRRPRPADAGPARRRARAADRGRAEVVGRLWASTNNALLCLATRRCPDPEPTSSRRASTSRSMGERPLDDFPDGTLARREVAAFAVSRGERLGHRPADGAARRPVRRGHGPALDRGRRGRRPGGAGDRRGRAPAADRGVRRGGQQHRSQGAATCCRSRAVTSTASTTGSRSRRCPSCGPCSGRGAASRSSPSWRCCGRSRLPRRRPRRRLRAAGADRGGRDLAGSTG